MSEQSLKWTVQSRPTRNPEYIYFGTIFTAAETGSRQSAFGIYTPIDVEDKDTWLEVSRSRGGRQNGREISIEESVRMTLGLGTEDGDDAPVDEAEEEKRTTLEAKKDSLVSRIGASLDNSLYDIAKDVVTRHQEQQEQQGNE
ncbi:hypothetical protein L198_05842 [Cryptococcus wingfieldii CBS 7118]|uniref:Uncharacterized protein n=1 Tax=Cryptococcus wingfieldii CBS 7118 TaxID=1295528 RepID=A0A1E3IUE1_9TREE|nr:hypothetical protein L198_05842 [Cryptococcus wingfieldii CBS 7118]ODN91331.1 hypothetical protein L198_05842 [Cryptococcus wingfieldii CBS 7118]